MENAPKSRIRLRFARQEPARLLTHLEQIKALRAVAAASGLKYWPSKPGHGAPKMSFGPAISVGHESACEYADLYLEDFVKGETAAAKIAALDDERFRLIGARRIPMFFPSVEAAVCAAEYEIEGAPGGSFSQRAVESFLELKSAPYERAKPSGERSTADARPLVLEAVCLREASALKLVLAFEPGRNVKPEIVFSLIAGPAAVPGRITRKELFWRDSAGRLEVF